MPTMARSGGKGWIRYRLLGMIGGRDEFATSPICLPMGSEFYALGKKKTIDSSPPCFSWRSKGARGRGLSRSKPRSGERKGQALQPPAPRSPSKVRRSGNGIRHLFLFPAGKALRDSGSRLASCSPFCCVGVPGLEVPNSCPDPEPRHHPHPAVEPMAAKPPAPERRETTPW